jgi:hypothetical protein
LSALIRIEGKQSCRAVGFGGAATHTNTTLPLKHKSQYGELDRAVDVSVMRWGGEWEWRWLCEQVSRPKRGSSSSLSSSFHTCQTRALQHTSASPATTIQHDQYSNTRMRACGQHVRGLRRVLEGARKEKRGGQRWEIEGKSRRPLKENGDQIRWMPACSRWAVSVCARRGADG